MAPAEVFSGSKVCLWGQSFCLFFRVDLVVLPPVVENPILLRLGGSIQPSPNTYSFQGCFWKGDALLETWGLVRGICEPGVGGEQVSNLGIDSQGKGR